MLHFVLCDDNELFAKKTASILENIFMKHDINAEISYVSPCADDILKYSESHTIDVLILDIDLNSNMTGLELAKEFRKNNKDAYIIFITGHFEYSMLAYKVKTFDYLIKPISAEKMEQTILRLYNDALENKKMFLSLNNGRYFIRESDILYIEKFKSKAIIHTTSSDVELYGTFNNIQNCLSDNFVRCHKSYIINHTKVTKIDTKNNILYLTDTPINYSKSFLNVENILPNYPQSNN